jgi:hypothetical protein
LQIALCVLAATLNPPLSTSRIAAVLPLWVPYHLETQLIEQESDQQLVGFFCEPLAPGAFRAPDAGAGRPVSLSPLWPIALPKEHCSTMNRPSGSQENLGCSKWLQSNDPA